MKVKTIVERKGPGLYTAGGRETVAEIASVLYENKIGAVAIIDADRHVCGIVSERDIVGSLARDGVSSLEKTVDELMSSPVHTCAPDEEIAVVAERMIRQGVRHLPVVEDARLVAVLSMRDVVSSRIAHLTEENKELITYMQS